MRHPILIAVLALSAAACGGTPQPVGDATPEAAPPAAAAAARDDATWKYFGEDFTVTEALPVAQVLDAPDQHASGPVRMSGELAEVCQSMGCWAVVRDDQGNSIRVTMKDHAFGIDKDTAGKACQVEGELVSSPVDPEKLAHYAEEGATEHPEAGKKVAWSLVASSVAVARN